MSSWQRVCQTQDRVQEEWRGDRDWARRRIRRVIVHKHSGNDVNVELGRLETLPWQVRHFKALPGIQYAFDSFPS